VRAAIEEALREAVVSGRLAPGSRLPSSRGLAADLGVSRNTVADAYGQLIAEGWLVAHQGSGTRVAEGVAGVAPVRRRSRPSEPQVRYNLRAGHPDVSSFPRSTWVAATRRALARAPHHVLDYGDPRGVLETRRALASYLGRVRGVRTTPERMLLCSGVTQGLSLLAAVLVEVGNRIGVEESGLAHHRSVLTSRGHATVPIPIDGEGADVRRLTTSGLAALLLTPAHQFPTGVSLSAARRTDVVGWARSADALVLEDDYDGEFRYDRQPVGALQALDPDRVVYCGTASKSLAPAVRMGWLALPERLLDPVVEAKRLADHHSSALDQLTLAELITSGQFDRHVRRARQHYRRRRDTLVQALAERVGHVRVSGIAAGHHLVIELPGPVDEAEEIEASMIERARGRGLAFDGLSAYRHPGSEPRSPGLVVGYGTPPDHAFAGAVEMLCRLLGQRE
jgi:GntR family transcriptional regulator/MocR family aminotransferase